MKFLVVAALIAVAAASDEVRNRRSAVWGGLGHGAVVQGAAAVLSGPSGVVSANTGAIAANPGVAAHGAWLGHGAWSGHGATLVAPNAHWAGSVISPGAVVVGPTTAGHPGVIAAPGLHGLGLGLGHGVLLG